MTFRVAGTALAGLLALGTTAAAQDRAEPPAAAAVEPPADDTTALLAFGQRLNGWFWDAEADSIWAHAGEDARTFLRNPTELGDQIYGFVGQFGVETRMLGESLKRERDNYRYTRVVHLDGSEVPWTVAWTFRPDLTIVNVSLDPGE